ncbi:hypothetical protein ACEWY4_003473 [Coilia grayii]|uniref:Uncharacterized protein n=1 Tax=Coilia grayii TaxID=363190 RepID=A0ABD1KRD5_9TELE
MSCSPYFVLSVCLPSRITLLDQHCGQMLLCLKCFINKHELNMHFPYIWGQFAQRALKLPATGEGLEFCHFEGIHSPKAPKQLYRNRVNELDLDAATKEKIVQEAVYAFHFNIEVFEELEEIGKTLKDEVMDTGMAVHGNMDGDINNCPYYAAQMHGYECVDT